MKGDFIMKKILSLILAAAMLFCLAACTPVSKDSIEPAVYRMEDEQYPRLSLRKDGTFSFVYTSMASRVDKGTYSVAEKVKDIFRELIRKQKFVFNKLFSISEKPKAEVVTAFSGVLELSRRNKIDTEQKEVFGDIIISKRKKEDF